MPATADQETEATKHHIATVGQGAAARRIDLTYFLPKIYHTVLNIFHNYGTRIESYKYPLKLHQ